MSARRQRTALDSSTAPSILGEIGRARTIASEDDCENDFAIGSAAKDRRFRGEVSLTRGSTQMRFVFRTIDPRHCEVGHRTP